MVNLLRPAKGNITQGYGYNKATGAWHMALDFGWGEGTGVYAAASGTCTYSIEPGYGLRASIRHSDGTKTTYSHLESIDTSGKGAFEVKAGERFATMGNSGSFAVFTHLHFEYWVNGIRVEPHFTSAPAGETGKPIKNKRKMLPLYETTESGATVWYLVTPLSIKRITSSTDASRYNADSDTTPVTASFTQRKAFWDAVVAQNVAAVANAVVIPAGQFTSADRTMLDDIASKGELTQALTSTVGLINTQATTNKNEILAAIDDIPAGNSTPLSITLSGTATTE